MFQRVSAVLGIATLALAGCNESPSGPGTLPCDEFLLSHTALAEADTVELANGVRYIDVEIGTGTTPINANTTATVNYTGYSIEPTGEVYFQSSCEPGLRAIGFHVGSGAIVPMNGYAVLKGFQYGVLGMNEQGVRRIIIPPSLGYGSVEENPEHFLAGKDLVFDLHVVGVSQSSGQY